MEPHERELLQEILELAKKNNKILHGMQVASRWGRFFKAIYWIIFIAIILGSTYYLQPYVDKMLEMYKTASTQLQDIQNSAKSVSGALQGVQNLKK